MHQNHSATNGKGDSMSVLDFIFVNWNGRMQLRKYVDSATHFHRVDEHFEGFKIIHLFCSSTSRVMYPQRHYSAIPYAFLIIWIVIELSLGLLQDLIRLSWADAQNTLTAYRQLTDYFLGRRRWGF